MATIRKIREMKQGYPLMRNHTAMAEKIWNALPDRQLHDQATFREPDGEGDAH